MSTVFRKARAGAPSGFFACEAAGLRWLAAAGGVGVATVLGVDDDALLLERLRVAPPTSQAAERLGVDLATTHAAGAPAFGSPPDGWSGDLFVGPLADPLVVPAGSAPTWGEAYARLRLGPLAGHLADRLGAVLGAYADPHGDLPDGWRDLLGLHQVFPVGLHVALFGESYGPAFDALLRTWG